MGICDFFTKKKNKVVPEPGTGPVPAKTRKFYDANNKVATVIYVNNPLYDGYRHQALSRAHPSQFRGTNHRPAKLGPVRLAWN